ncbi:MAG: hypothetical protein FXF47_03825 [Candidatus Mcinerneyibacterium aminivorans]|uniref:Uncharacterized protein n=1 Tax=Candidatus Mcinerneyibacterium aminivorans TaxID=2703815 RepID=A0A5D0MIL5_9BACT|nr:MAG: hypothetical protein FXF47_03825 [Candidatus Mcinerneyibacterium aminivorans]
MGDIEKILKTVENKTQKEFILKERILKFFLILGIIIPVIFYFIFTVFDNISYELNHFFFRYLINIFAYLLLGIFEGKYEYNFWAKFRNLLRKKEMKKIYRNYIYIVGVFSWGLPIGITFIIIEWDLNAEVLFNFGVSILNLIIWTAGGYFYGHLYKSKIKNYIKNNYKL